MISKTSKEKICKDIKPLEIVHILKELIKIQGHRELPERENKVTEYLLQWFEKGKFDVKGVEVVPGRINLIARLNGSANGASLMYNCHMDTVPEYGWVSKPGPFEPIVENNRVYGRGSCDMKGAIASVMVAMRAIKASGIELKGDLVFAGVIGEEGEGSIGTKALVEKNIITDMAVVCEPTNLNISIGHRGSSNISLACHGIPAHTAYPERGVNAITMMSTIIESIDKELYPKLKRRKHKLFGPPSLTPAVIQGGMRTDVVPDLCEVRLNYRYSQGQDPSLLKEEIKQLISKLQKQRPNVRAEVEILTDALGMETSSDHTIVKSLKKALKLIGKQSKIVGSGFWTDASILSNKGGIPSVLFGPGKEEVAHSVNEYVDIEQLCIASQAYALTGLEVCNKK